MNRSQFMKVLAKYGATLDTDSEECNLNVDAPIGKVFKANGCHTIVEPFSNNGGQSWKSEAYAEAAARVSMGGESCTDPDCDSCVGDKECTCDRPNLLCPIHDNDFEDGEL